MRDWINPLRLLTQTRVVDFPTTLPMGLSTLDFNYCTRQGTAPSSAVTVAQIPMTCTPKAGSMLSGAQSWIEMVSLRAIMKNECRPQ